MLLQGISCFLLSPNAERTRARWRGKVPTLRAATRSLAGFTHCKREGPRQRKSCLFRDPAMPALRPQREAGAARRALSPLQARPEAPHSRLQPVSQIQGPMHNMCARHGQTGNRKTKGSGAPSQKTAVRHSVCFLFPVETTWSRHGAIQHAFAAEWSRTTLLAQQIYPCTHRGEKQASEDCATSLELRPTTPTPSRYCQQQKPPLPPTDVTGRAQSSHQWTASPPGA